MMCEVNLKGLAKLCFNPDNSWFQGHLVTDDECYFTLTGVRSSVKNGSRVNGKVLAADNDACDVYNLRLHDVEQFLDYELDDVIRRKKEHKCCLQSQNVQFESTQFFRGQKADMMIQRLIPVLVGKNFEVYEGEIKIMTSQLIADPKWSM